MESLKARDTARSSPQKKARSELPKTALQKREEKWNIPAVTAKGFSDFDTDKSKYQPKTSAKNSHNNDKGNAQQKQIKGKSITYLSNYEVAPGEMNMSVMSMDPSLSVAIPITRDSADHVDIPQRIHIRENLLSELHKLIRSAIGITSVINEIEELVKAIRYQTLDIIEAIYKWQQNQRHYPTIISPYMFYGSNYLLKLVSDLDFLDEHDVVVERFCFEFTGNPLAYRDGGNMKFSNEFQSKIDEITSIYDNYLTDLGAIDVVEQKRLRDAERILSMEIARLNHQQSTYNTSIMHTGNKTPALSYENHEDLRIGFVDSVDYDASIFAFSKLHPSSSALGKQETLSKEKIHSTPYIPKQRKPQRIKQLQSDIDELHAIKGNLEEQVVIWTDQHNELMLRKRKLDYKLGEATRMGREAVTHVTNIELGLVVSEMQDNQLRLRDLQRQTFEISLEQRRKRLIINQLSDEVADDKKQRLMKKKFTRAVREHGIQEAIKMFSGLMPNPRARQLSPLKTVDPKRLWSPKMYRDMISYQQNILKKDHDAKILPSSPQTIVESSHPVVDMDSSYESATSPSDVDDMHNESHIDADEEFIMNLIENHVSSEAQDSTYQYLPSNDVIPMLSNIESTSPKYHLDDQQQEDTSPSKTDDLFAFMEVDPGQPESHNDDVAGNEDDEYVVDAVYNNMIEKLELLRYIQASDHQAEQITSSCDIVCNQSDTTCDETQIIDMHPSVTSESAHDIIRDASINMNDNACSPKISSTMQEELNHDVMNPISTVDSNDESYPPYTRVMLAHAISELTISSSTSAATSPKDSPSTHSSNIVNSALEQSIFDHGDGMLPIEEGVHDAEHIQASTIDESSSASLMSQAISDKDEMKFVYNPLADLFEDDLRQTYDHMSKASIRSQNEQIDDAIQESNEQQTVATYVNLDNEANNQESEANSIRVNSPASHSFDSNHQLHHESEIQVHMDHSQTLLVKNDDACNDSHNFISIKGDEYHNQAGNIIIDDSSDQPMLLHAHTTNSDSTEPIISSLVSSPVSAHSHHDSEYLALTPRNLQNRPDASISAKHDISNTHDSISRYASISSLGDGSMVSGVVNESDSGLRQSIISLDQSIISPHPIQMNSDGHSQLTYTSSYKSLGSSVREQSILYFNVEGHESTSLTDENVSYVGQSVIESDITSQVDLREKSIYDTMTRSTEDHSEDHSVDGSSMGYGSSTFASLHTMAQVSLSDTLMVLERSSNISVEPLEPSIDASTHYDEQHDDPSIDGTIERTIDGTVDRSLWEGTLESDNKTFQSSASYSSYDSQSTLQTTKHPYDDHSNHHHHHRHHHHSSDSMNESSDPPAQRHGRDRRKSDQSIMSAVSMSSDLMSMNTPRAKKSANDDDATIDDHASERFAPVSAGAGYKAAKAKRTHDN